MSDHDHEEHASHGPLYFSVFLGLCGLTAISVVADLMKFSNHNVLAVIVMAVAVAKALCVMMFFMHLKFERAWKYILLAPTIILAAAIPFALAPDIAMNYYTSESPQLLQYEIEQARAGSDDHEKPHH